MSVAPPAPPVRGNPSAPASGESGANELPADFEATKSGAPASKVAARASLPSIPFALPPRKPASLAPPSRRHLTSDVVVSEVATGPAAGVAVEDVPTVWGAADGLPPLDRENETRIEGPAPVHESNIQGPVAPRTPVQATLTESRTAAIAGPPELSNQPPTVEPDDAEASDGLPTQFGKYTLLRKLATGGMAELFLAIQRSMAGFEKLVVVKRILPKMNQDAAFIDMLMNEARVAATMSHPNIVQTFDVGEVDGTYYIAMEHIEGEDIRAIVRQLKKLERNAFPLEHALEIIRGLCAGLSYAHGRQDLEGTPLNIVHRDISPQNVVVTFSGDVKIVDFGIAKSDQKFATETGFGRLKGKIPYMSPEQARGLDLDGRSDIFSAGVMLFELTTGRRLFKGASEYETLRMICDSPYPLPSQIRADYPVELEAIVMRALAKDRDSRFRTALEMQAALENFARERRIVTSSVVLGGFMRDIFASELAAGREAVLSDKRLAAEVLRLRQSSSDFPMPSKRPSAASIRVTTPNTASLPNHGPNATISTAEGGTLQVAAGAALEADGRPGSGHSVGDSGDGQGPTTQRSNLPSAPSSPDGSGALNYPGSRPYSWGTWVGIAAAVVGLVGIGVFVGVKSLSKSKGGIGTEVAVQKGALRIESDPKGATVWVDGAMQRETTPTRIEGMPVARDLHVKLTKEGFDPTEGTLRIDSAGGETAHSFVLEKGSLVIEWSVEPKTAAVSIDDISTTGTRATDLTSDLDHVVVASAPGYTDERLVVRGESHEIKHVDLKLHKSTASLLGVGSLPLSAFDAGAKADTGRVLTPVVVAPTGRGILNVAASGGWCNVTVDGIARGATPVAGLDLPSGPHQVSCTTAEGQAQSTSIVVPVDGAARHKFSL